MARYCFYCNRELLAGESCQCRERARRSASEARARENDKQEPSKTDFRSRTRPTRRHRLQVDWQSLLPSLRDFTHPLDQLSRAANQPQPLAAAVWAILGAFSGGLFATVLAARSGLNIASSRVFVFGLFTAFLFDLLHVLILYAVQRRHGGRSLSLRGLVARGRPAFLYGAVLLLLASLVSGSSIVYGILLAILAYLAQSAGLLAQIRFGSPIDGNRFVHLCLAAYILQAAATGLVLQLLFELMVL